MAFTVDDLLADVGLRLRLVAGRGNTDRAVVAAHVSEMPRPGEWLQGGELLMTIGLRVPLERHACRAFVREVIEGGASALALGLGHDQPYQAPPEVLITAADEVGLPLLTVPDEVPFIKVTKAVFAARAAEERQALERSVGLQHRLTAAAASGRGLDPILAVWQDATGLPAAVTDLIGRVLASTGDDARQLLDASTDLIAQVEAHGLHGSAAADVAGSTVSVLPVGAHRVRGYAVVAGAGENELRLQQSALISLMTLELERRHLASEPQRRARATLLGKLLVPNLSERRARDLLAAANIATKTVRGLAIQTDANETADLAADLAIALPGGLVHTANGTVEALVIEDSDLTGLLRSFAPDKPTGIGAAVDPHLATITLRQARSLTSLSNQLGRPATPGEDSTSGLLLSICSPEHLTALADTVLAPIDAADRRGELTTTLQTWLDCNGALDITARHLRIHRHTVRNRIAKIEKLLDRPLDTATTRHELWLGLQARDAQAHVRETVR